MTYLRSPSEGIGIARDPGRGGGDAEAQRALAEWRP